ncbi:hypothetical protein [Streptomyces sp. NPDC046197]|uniref:hypothetical protein n=1 Tax=Streptomyces sp. NPDC046197 TaxID=3154337 RepID=UPI0033CBB12E
MTSGEPGGGTSAATTADTDTTPGTDPQPDPDAQPDPGDGPDHLAGGDPGQGEAGLTEYLFFFLGLLPTLIAGIRIYLIAHGDRTTMLELLGTLNVSALVLDTFIRFIGVIGGAVTAFLLVRLLLERPESPPRSWLRRVIWNHRRPALWLLAGTFAAFISTAYLEEFYDADNRWTCQPVDLFRIYAWLAVLYVGRAPAVRAWRRRSASRRPSLDGTTAGTTDSTTAGTTAGIGAPDQAQTPAAPARSPWRLWGAATYTLLPVAVLMTWSLLKQSDDRMWLPAQVITLNGVPALVTQEGIQQDPKFPHLNVEHDGHYTFVGYVLDDDGTSETVLSSNGVLLTADSKDVVDQEFCQYEPTHDVADDTPFIDRMLNHDDSWNPGFSCEDLLKKVIGPKDPAHGLVRTTVDGAESDGS